MKTVKHLIFGSLFVLVLAVSPKLANAITINPDFTVQLVSNGVNLRINSIGTSVDASIKQITFQADYTPTTGQAGTPTPGSSSSYTFLNNGSTQLPVTIPLSAPGLKACTEYSLVMKGQATYIDSNNQSQTQSYAVSLPTKAKTPGCATDNTTNNPTNTNNTTNNPTNSNTTNNGSTGGAFSKLENPLGSINSIPEFIKRLIDIALVIGVPVVALAIIYSGFLMVTARGDVKKLEKGKKAFLAAIIGGAILLGAYVIANAIDATIKQIRG